MKQFNYLFGRLLGPGLTLVNTFSFLLLLLVASFAGSLYSYHSADIIRLQKSGHAQLEFSANTGQDKLLIKYDRQEYIRDLTQNYTPYLRGELDELPLPSAQPDIEDKAVMTYRNYLLNQQSDVTFNLRIAQGFSDSEYYFSMYVPSQPSDLSQFLPDGDRSTAQAYESLIQAGLASISPFDRAYAKNLEGQLPLRFDAFSASGILYELMRSFRFYLVFIPLGAFLLLFDPVDRNFRAKTTKLTVQKILACFLYSATVITAMRLLIYGFLTLRFGDAEGSMYVVPAWTDLSSGVIPPIFRLREMIVYLTLIDLSFVFFVTAFCALLYHLIGDSLSAVAATIFSLLLPGINLVSTLGQPTKPVVSPFQYLFWDIRMDPSRVTDHWIVLSAGETIANSQDVIVSLFISILVLLMMLPLVIRLQDKIKHYRTKRLLSQTHPE